MREGEREGSGSPSGPMTGTASLPGPNDWQEGDQKEEAARVAWETHFTTVLVAYLDTMDDKVSSLDAFMAAYKDLPQNQEAPGATYDLPIP
jgi:hypothetical protein